MFNEKDIKKMLESFQKMKKVIAGVFKEFKGLDFKDKLGVFNDLLSSMGNLFGLVKTVTGAIVGLGKEIFNMSQAGAEFNTIRDGFYNLAGGIDKAKKELALFRKAASFNLNDKELMSFANNMYTIGVNGQQTAQILDLIEDSGDRVGLSFNKASEVIGNFLQSGDSEGLSKLKLDVSAVSNEIEKLTGALGKNIDQLTDAEKQQINTQAILNLYGKSIDEISNKQLDSSDNVILLQTTLENLQNSFQSLLADAIGPIVGIARKFIDEYRKMFEVVFGGKDAIEKLKESFMKFTKEALQYWFEQWKNNYKPALQQLLESIKKIIKENPDLIEGFKGFLKFLIDAGTFISSTMLKTLDLLLNVLNKIKHTVDSINPVKGLKKILSGITGGKGSGLSGDIDLFTSLKEQVDRQEEEERNIFDQNNSEDSNETFQFDYRTAFFEKLDLERRYQLALRNEWDIEKELLAVYRFKSLWIEKELMDKESFISLTEKENALIKEHKELSKKADEALHREKKEKQPGKSKFERFETRLESMTSIGIVVQTIMELFTDNTKTAVHYIVSGFESARTIVQGIKSIFENIKLVMETFQTAKDIGSFLLDILPIPFATGGKVPGYGTGDTIPAMLTPGEFVVRKSVVDKFGSSFFAWLNGGLLPSMAGKYAMGGLVTASPSPIVKNSFDVHIDRRGDVSVVQKALRKLNSNRSYFGG